MNRIAEAARFIADARRARRVLSLLPEAIRPRDVAEAYSVQNAVHALLGARRLGTKIGCTTKVMQDYLGIPSPCSAGVFADGVRESGVILRFDDYRRIGIECEIAVRLGRDLSAGPFDAANVVSAADAYMAAVEIVDDRYADWRTTDTPTLIADDFFAAGAVFGTPVPARGVDPAAWVGVTKINDAEAGRGTGADVMGHPLNALAWLANDFATRGAVVRAGDIVLLGSLVETRWLARGDRAEIAISGLGEVALSVI